MKTFWRVTQGDGPVVATAIHNGHQVSAEVSALLALSDADRLREEDPFTGLWTDVAGTHVVVDLSRFQVDLNRPREKAVYIRPEDAWGLRIWEEEPERKLVERSLQEYDRFYEQMFQMLSGLVEQFGRIVVLDLHTYNHRRRGPEAAPAEPESNPEVNLGTGSMDRQLWAPIVERFTHDLLGFDFLGRKLDVRENIKFQGGEFSRWSHRTFPGTVCVLAVEVKKFFMDEWTGQLDSITFNAIHKALGSTIPGIREELTGMRGRE